VPTWHTKAFGAKELFRMAQPDGRIGHAELLTPEEMKAREAAQKKG